jgi:6-phosphofructokinase 1
VPLDVQAVRGILPRGGTILGSSRTNPLKNPGGGRNGIERIKDNLAGLGVDALIAIGGEDTLGVATRLGEQGVPVVGVPKTIDNDLSATDYTFGFDTAVNIAMEAIDRLHTTAESHHRALIAIGGEDTLGVATRLGEQGVPVVGVPKTIDNDLSSTDYTFGFDTAVNIAMEAIDRLHTTAESHHRALIVEVMGRHAGWIALHAGLAGGANVILIPERPFDIERVCAYVQHRFQTRFAPIVVVAEGAHPVSEDLATSSEQLDSFGHVRLGGVGQMLAYEIEKRTGKEARCTVLGHIQRGGTPTAFDRVLATRFGVHAVQAVHDEAFGVMVALRGTDIVRVPLVEATSQLKLVPPQRYAEAEVFFG